MVGRRARSTRADLLPLPPRPLDLLDRSDRHLLRLRFRILASASHQVRTVYSLSLCLPGLRRSIDQAHLASDRALRCRFDPDRDMIASIKLLVVGWHELCHLVVGVVCGGEVELYVRTWLTPSGLHADVLPLSSRSLPSVCIVSEPSSFFPECRVQLTSFSRTCVNCPGSQHRRPRSVQSPLAHRAPLSHHPGRSERHHHPGLLVLEGAHHPFGGIRWERTARRRVDRESAVAPPASKARTD